MTEQEAPKIEFPCDYPIKVMGKAHPDFHAYVLEVMHRHAPDFDPQRVGVRDSSKGTFQAITITIMCTGQPQLEAIFADLKDHDLVHMVI